MSIDDYPDDETTTGVLSLDLDAIGRFDDVPPYDEYFYDADWFRIVLVAGNTYEFIGTTTVYMELDVFGGQYRLESYQSGFDFDRAILTITALESGTYFIQAANVLGEQEGTYRIDANIYEIPGHISTRIFLAEDDVRTQEIETAFDRDFYRITLHEGWTYQIDVEGVDSGAGTLANPFLRIYDADGQLLASQNNGGQGRNSRLEFEAPLTGVHYISAAGLGAGIGTYQVNYTLLNYVDDAATGPSTSSQITLRANQISTLQGQLEIGSDIDWHKIDLVAGRWYQMSGARFLRDPDNEIVLRLNGYTFFQAEKSGIHHLVVRNPAGVPRNYRIVVTDNFPVPLRTRAAQFDLSGGESLTLAQLFSLNSFPAEQIQVYAEAPFTIGSTPYAAFRLHTLPAGQLDQAVFYAEDKRGEYQVHLRAIDGSTRSGWAVANVVSERTAASYLGNSSLWNSSNTQRGSDHVITYRFADSIPSYFAPGRFTGFEAVGQNVRNVFELIFGFGTYPESLSSTLPQISNYANLRFEYEDSEDADIQIFTADSTQPAIGHRPGTYGFGDIVLSNTQFGNSASEPLPGEESHFQILRAVGTALGIQHWQPELSREQSIVGTGTLLPESYGYWDTEFLRSQYGVSPLVDPVHWGREDRLGDSSEPFFRTINRQSPANKIDASYAEQPVVIDLRQGALSYLEDRSQTFVIGKRQVIERAIGSDFDDKLTGNHSDNRMLAMEGDDVISGLGGNDAMLGGPGSDIYLYETGDGHDTIQEAGTSRAHGGIDTLRLTGKFGMNRLEEDLSFRRNGRDLIIDLDMNNEFNRYNGSINIRFMDHAAWQVERLDLRNFSEQLGVFSLVSIWNAATHEKQRFQSTGQFDAFGLIATPLGS